MFETGVLVLDELMDIMTPMTSIGARLQLPPDESEGCFAIVPDQENATPKRSHELPHPSKHTKEQHPFAAHMMRERMAMILRRAKQQSEEQASNAISPFRNPGFCAGPACEIQAGQWRR